jgi:hypothetical protein
MPNIAYRQYLYECLERCYLLDTYRQESRKMAEKILATFRIDSDKWEQFKARTGEKNSSASAMLLEFVDWYLAGNELPSRRQADLGNLEALLDNRLHSMLDERLDQRWSAMQATLNQFSSRLERAEAALGESLP